MKDHENSIVKQVHERYHKLCEEVRLLEDKIFWTASIPDKIHACLTMFAIMVAILAPIYMIIQIVKIYLPK